MKATRKDVANLAKVSEQTVSYIINGTRTFSKDVMDRVNDAVKNLNYQPNMIAKSLASKKTKTVCLIVEDIRNPIWGEIIRGFEAEAIKHGYFVSLINGKSDFENLAKNIIARNFDGVYITLIAGDDMEKLANQVSKAGIKIVLGNKIILNKNKEVMKNISSVDSNLVEGMEKAVKYLYDNGHKNIAYISGLDILSPYDLRYSTFINVCKRLKINYSIIENIFPFDTTIDVGFALGKKFLEMKKNETAIILTNDLMAMGFLDCMKNNKVSIPEDISMVSFDNIFFSKYTSPPLTTIKFDKKYYGKQLFLSLLKLIETQISESISVSCEVEIGNTVKKIN